MSTNVIGNSPNTVMVDAPIFVTKSFGQVRVTLCSDLIKKIFSYLGAGGNIQTGVTSKLYLEHLFVESEKKHLGIEKKISCLINNLNRCSEEYEPLNLKIATKLKDTFGLELFRPDGMSGAAYNKSRDITELAAQKLEDRLTLSEKNNTIDVFDQQDNTQRHINPFEFLRLTEYREAVSLFTRGSIYEERALSALASPEIEEEIYVLMKQMVSSNNLELSLVVLFLLNDDKFLQVMIPFLVNLCNETRFAEVRLYVDKILSIYSEDVAFCKTVVRTVVSTINNHIGLIQEEKGSAYYTALPRESSLVWKEVFRTSF
jgi:hypothetical protein